ncbi:MULTISPECIES: prephenate dehydrogenase/arogenate dehydrogenase family protein [unclassified Duganella]|uniref:prephenate dehydrogenase n=1 Tax=unclassified Duganella TaxID=2636909 RepID=UPI0006FE152C|nr:MULTISPECIES: prephenate dehydrogenase/arogenate dehydrogenase family protein [unclassified Duganella]KQV45436.1 prephenate dehydrogenase [Duganella sp. Root336D2]KRC00698.1 prephenate dehydrogenase [Duganella sp. Root198D2]
MLNKVVIFGVGLIGGSFARALKAAGAVKHVVGVDRSEAFLSRALELGIIDSAAETGKAVSDPQGQTPAGYRFEEAIAGADLILLAAPVAQTARILASILPHLDASTIVTDAGSTKSDVVAAARAVMGDKVRQFIPGHPIAGRETNGPDAAIIDLYQGKKTVLTPLAENDPAAVERVASAWKACGAIIHTLTPEEHDKVFAAVSHLPHLLAYALVDDIERKPHSDLLFQYAASGFRDFTRIAGSSPEMWRDISLANQAALLTELDAYLAQLTRLRASLAAGDAAALEATYVNAQRARRQWIETIEAAEPPQPKDAAAE